MRAYFVFSSTEPVLVVSRQSVRSRPVLDDHRDSAPPAESVNRR